jgi:hypothetical protein
MMNPTPDTPGKDWHSYIAVENVDEYAERVPSLGGRVLVAPMCQSLGACAPWLIPPEQSHSSYRRSTSDADGLEAERGNGVTFGWRSGCAG